MAVSLGNMIFSVKGKITGTKSEIKQKPCYLKLEMSISVWTHGFFPPKIVNF